ncbi:hypothetical protein dsx2_2622 [Desulfovibrio sp. X2]|uniref:hypothetical protein n=1 Tax=Desulfovibrio sp. X2 TaxID=941449 RepID=UPI000358A00C|nr:hypothetical protein [Desulfovibrio sp. X2]EPR42705.1 hypothetical protein dsx2_2622 [Desulfovibrio sp. X2]
MRTITTHHVHEGDRQPVITALGEVGTGGAEQEYEIIYPGKDGLDEIEHLVFVSLDHPGITNEALLAIVIDRLEGFQAVPFACTENAAALDHARICLGELQARTRHRMMRGVEGKAEA